jgi:hypothetical protein
VCINERKQKREIQTQVDQVDSVGISTPTENGLDRKRVFLKFYILSN